MKNSMILPLMLFALLLGGANLQAEEAVAGPSWSRSLDVSIGGVYASKSDFNIAKWAYSPMLTYNYALGEDYALGVTLLKFTHFLSDGTSKPQLFSFAYGLQFTHWLPKKLLDLGMFKPWLAYSILLNQTFVENTPGRSLAHDTRIAAGVDFLLAPRFRLFSELVWDMSSFGTFGVDGSTVLMSETAGFGLRLMF